MATGRHPIRPAADLAADLGAYVEGRQAHGRGAPIAACPYPLGSPDRPQWVAGWCHRNAECAASGDWPRVNPQGAPTADG